MSRKRPDRPLRTAARTEARIEARDARQLVRDRERLAALEIGGSRERPIPVSSSSVIEVRVRSLACPQCRGEYRLRDHLAPAPGLREIEVTCVQCGVPRTLWFRLVSDEPN